jgi:3-hydroxyacyl-[acyl-carrier-protein] dehydratase
MNKLFLNTKEKYLSIDALTTRRLVPHRFPMMLLDRVAGFYYEEQRCLGIKTVSQNDPVLPGHFPDFPIYPGVLLIEAMAQASGALRGLNDMLDREGSMELVLERLRKLSTLERLPPEMDMTMVLVESKVKHANPVYPGSVVEMESLLTLQRDNMAVFKVSASVEGEEVSRGQVMLAKMTDGAFGEASL